MTEQIRCPPAVAQPALPKFVPGYLLTPFGWAAHPLAAMVAAEPQLLADLFELDRTRMHLIALALAHLDDQALPQLGPVLVRASAREILDRVLGRSPPGIKGMLRRLPYVVLSRESYRRLVRLLDQPQTAKLLHHLADREIAEAVIELLDQVPAPLRSVSLAVLGFVHRLEHLPDGLRFLAARGAAPSFDALVADLATQSQPTQFVARIRHLVAALPLPHSMPPAQIGLARRLDATGEICALAKRFHNCLAKYTERVNDGQCAIYLWEDLASPAACQVSRHGRLGWFLNQALGPGNVELEPQQLQRIRRTFADAGVPDDSIIYPIECILQSDWAMHAGRRPRRH